METYKFKLIDSKVPVVRGKNIITDSNVGGTKNIYKIYEVKSYICKWILIRKLVGKRIFWRPYHKSWGTRVPAPYWGKGPLLNVWLVLFNDYDNPAKVPILIQESDTMHHCTAVCGIQFKSQELNRNLKLNQTFYQSKFVKS